MICKFLYKLFLALLLVFSIGEGTVYAQEKKPERDTIELDHQISRASDATVNLNGRDYMEEGGDTGGRVCRTSTLNEITAAFNTQGYWFLDFLVASFKSGLGGWAALLYACVVFGGIMMLAMGQPPRMYLWFILGPLIFNWMLYTAPADGGGSNHSVKGVCWYVGNKKISQKRVWELAEAGMVNMPFAPRVTNNGNVKINKINYDINDGPYQLASNLPALFLFIDEVISEPIAWVIEISGIKSKRANESGNLVLQEPHEFKNEITSDEVENAASWYVLGNTRWEELIDVTNASLEGNDDLRELLVRFMASDCGDILADAIDDNAYLTAGARKAGGGALPDSVFLEDVNLRAELEKKIVSVPPEMREIMKDYNASGSGDDYDSTLAAFIETTELQGLGQGLPGMRNISCSDYLYFIVQGFRWASAVQYNMLVKRGTDLGIPATWVTYNFLYGWRFGFDRPKQIKLYSQAWFVMNMILSYMFRNELSTATKPIDQTYTTSQRLENYLNANIRSVGSMSKGMEFYQWSKLVPYMQGICLYILAAGYPLACILMLIPGWHKAFFTWIGFYAWAKSWDAGFAFIGALDKNIWGMLGNSDDAAYINKKIHDLDDLGSMVIHRGITSPDVSGASCDMVQGNALIGCVTPVPQSYGTQSYEDAFSTFDQALLLANNLQHDLANGYYIYLMSALYFAVPAVTGQLFLGAKAGMASLATQGIGSVAGDAGRAAGTGYTSEMANRGYHAMAVTGQEAFSKSMNNDGLAAQALGFENASMQESMSGSENSLTASMVSANADRLSSMYDAQSSANSGLNGAFDKGEQYFRGKAGAQDSLAKRLLKEDGGKNKPDDILGYSDAVRGAQKANGIAGKINKLSMGTSLVGGAVGMMKANAAGKSATIAAHYNAAAQQAQAASQYHRGQAGRYQEAAQQKAAEAQWKAQRRLGNQMAGSSAAIGVMAGAFTAGAKPTSMNGMIGLGYMDNNKAQDVGYGLNYGGLSLQGESAYGTFGTTGEIGTSGDAKAWTDMATSGWQTYDSPVARADSFSVGEGNNHNMPTNEGLALGTSLKAIVPGGGFKDSSDYNSAAGLLISNMDWGKHGEGPITSQDVIGTFGSGSISEKDAGKVAEAANKMMADGN